MLINIIAGLLGVLFIAVAKMQSLKIDAEKANLGFSAVKYIQREWLALASSLLSVAIWLVLFDEVVNKYPQLGGWIKCTFFAMGALGTWVLHAALGRTKGWIRGVVDEKTNIADNKSNL
jgi:hypothetical protein